MRYKITLQAEAEDRTALALEVEHIAQLILLEEDTGENYKVTNNHEENKTNQDGKKAN